ncbi:Scaffold-type E3 ligase [Tulasnella sp. 403]|nr:Scaffold-type E3 ligase [Tulasnella sp. 403]
MSSQAKKDAAIAHFRSVTGAGQTDSLRFLKKANYRVDVAVDMYYSDAAPQSSHSGASKSELSTQKIRELFESFQDSPESIGVDGTIKLCEALEVDPEDVVLLALAFEFKSPRLAEWPLKGWTDGMKSLACDSTTSLKAQLPKLRDRLASDPDYFRQVYGHTFTLGLAQGQRSLLNDPPQAIDTAIAFWTLLLPLGLNGGALAHVDDLNAEEPSSSTPGWREEHTQWWFEFLGDRNAKGISKDTWNMFIDFVRTIDDKFEKHDTEGLASSPRVWAFSDLPHAGSWPSSIDDFVEFAKKRAGGTTS